MKQLPENIKEPLFEKKQEGALLILSQDLKKMLENSMLHQGYYEEIFQAVADAKPDVDSFFDNVMVMADDAALRDNRIALLNSVVQPIKQLFNLNELI